MEMLVRIANDRYIRNKTCKTISDAFKLLLDEKMKNLISGNSTQT